MHASIDTNIILRLIINEIPEQHNKSHALLSQKGVKFHIIDQVFVELEYALRMHYKFDRPIICNALQTIISQKNIVSNKELLFNTLTTYGVKLNISFVDCMLAEHATQSKASPLYTFDKKLAQLENVELLK
jgi:predicted nucleic-acid-binding protein